MTYNVVDEEHGVVQVDGDIVELEGVKCGISQAMSKSAVVTELRTGAKISENLWKNLAIIEAKSRIRSVEFGPAMVRTKTALERMGISYPVNKV